MPRHGAYLVGDLDPTQLCRIACRKCDREGAYRRDTLAERFGLDHPMPDVLLKVAKETCPKHGSFSDPCGAVFLDPEGATSAERDRLKAEVAAGRQARATSSSVADGNI